MVLSKPYAFDARPRVRSADGNLLTTNCRRLVQEYFTVRHGLFMPRVAVEMPGAVGSDRNSPSRLSATTADSQFH